MTKDLPYYTKFGKCNISHEFKASEMPSDVQENIKSVYLIIQACNENELHASLEEMDSSVISVMYEKMTLYLGRFADYPCALIVTHQGHRCKSDLEEILRVCTRACLILGIGVAAGFGKAKLGDVLVASMIAHYNNSTVQDGAISHGERRSVSNKIENAFVLSDAHEWNFQCSTAGRLSVAITGVIASSPYLVDSKEWVRCILAQNPEVKGLEMEGYILQEIAKENNLDVGIIKGVCDSAGMHGKKSKEWQYTAAKAAANYAKFRLKHHPFMSG